MYRASRLSAIGLIGDPAPKKYLTRVGFLMEAFTGQGKLFERQLATNSKELKPRYPGIGFAGCVSRASGRHRSVSVTHRFLRQGK